MYVFDTNSFRVLANFYPLHFPSLWTCFDDLVNDGKIISTDQNLKEMENQNVLADWRKQHKSIFQTPSRKETEFIKEIFKVLHFQALINEQAMLQNREVADPFLIAKAKLHGFSVVTEEKDKPNSAQIPTICRHFNIHCVNLEGFMEKQNWQF